MQKHLKIFTTVMFVALNLTIIHGMDEKDLGNSDTIVSKKKGTSEQPILDPNFVLRKEIGNPALLVKAQKLFLDWHKQNDFFKANPLIVLYDEDGSPAIFLKQMWHAHNASFSNSASYHLATLLGIESVVAPCYDIELIIDVGTQQGPIPLLVEKYIPLFDDATETKPFPHKSLFISFFKDLTKARMIGSLGAGMDGSKTDLYRSVRETVKKNLDSLELQKFFILDVILYETNKHLGNVMLNVSGNGTMRPVNIDRKDAFSFCERNQLSDLFRTFLGERKICFSGEMLPIVQAWKVDDIKQGMKDYGILLGEGYSQSIDFMCERLTKIQSLIQGWVSSEKDLREVYKEIMDKATSHF